MDTVTNILPLGHHDCTNGALVERYLQEKTGPFIDAITYGCPVEMTLPSIYPARHSLTWSSQSQTSTGSVPLSQPADSDIMYDGANDPPTPELSAPSPPYESTTMAVQQWDSQHLQHARFSLAYVPPRSHFVNPSDISHDFAPTPPADSNDDARGLGYLDYGFQCVDDSAIDPNLLPGGSPQEAGFVLTAAIRHAADKTSPDEAPTEGMARTQRARAHKPRRVRVPKKSTPAHPRIQERARRGEVPSKVKTERLVPRTRDADHCEFCNEFFKNAVSLRRHVRSSHRRPFTCVFHYAGCQSTFGAKNEWKRHVLSQHLGLYYWHCTLDHCSQANPLHAHGRSSAPGIPTRGSIFNRKDLYTQHVRRMHLGADNGSNRASQEAEERLKVLQEAAKKKRCELPLYMGCPAVGCAKDFRGSKAWDERMEHVACHLGRAAAGKEEDVLFGGEHDSTLTKWAASPAVGVAVSLPGGGWQHRNPLKGSSNDGIALAWTASSSPGDQDAEGEDCLSE